MTMMSSLELQQKRWIVRTIWTAIYLFIPFIELDGQSVLRFDISSLGLLFFGTTIYIESFFIVLIFTFFLTFLIILITQLYGRIWCGWLCPQTVIMTFTKFLDVKNQSLASRLLGHIFTLVISAIIGSSMVWYFVSPYKFFAGLADGTLNSATLWFAIVLIIISYLNFHDIFICANSSSK